MIKHKKLSCIKKLLAGSGSVFLLANVVCMHIHLRIYTHIYMHLYVLFSKQLHSCNALYLTAGMQVNYYA